MADEVQGTPPAPQAPPPPAAPTPPPPGAVPPPASMAGRPGPASDNSKLLAAGGYIIWIIALVALLMDPYKNEKFVKFHAVQALGIGVAWVVCSVIIVIPYIGWVIGSLLYVGIVVLAIMAAVKAYGGEYWEIPVLYGVVRSFIGE